MHIIELLVIVMVIIISMVFIVCILPSIQEKGYYRIEHIPKADHTEIRVYKNGKLIDKFTCKTEIKPNTN